MAGWDNFFVAQVGASAALTGLIFVGVSINLSRIISLGGVAERALEALVILLAVLVTSSLLLVPGQPFPLIGIELLLVGLVDLAVLLILFEAARRKTLSDYRKYLRLRIIYNILTALPFMIAGISVLIWGAGGLYWVVLATIACFLVAIFDAWVILVEINR